MQNGLNALLEAGRAVQWKACLRVEIVDHQTLLVIEGDKCDVMKQLRWACAGGLPRGVVLMDAGYGADTDLRTSITDLGLNYVAGIQPQTSVWRPGTGPRAPKK